MSKRRPLPYAACGLIDEALMALSEARRYIKPLLDKGDLETVARTGKALDELNKACAALTEIKSIQPED